MLVNRIVVWAMVSWVAPLVLAAEPAVEITAAQEKYRSGDFDEALKQLETLLKANNLDAESKQRASRLAAQVLEARGSQHFRQGQVAESIADFDRQLQWQPSQAAEHWKRGIAYYYAGEYEKGKQQFELHQKVNPQDVENAAWHFLCIVRAPQGSIEAAQKSLIPITHDPRAPMAQIHKMFAGKTKPEEVLEASKKAGPTAQFYADLYVGLYYEALGRNEDSLRHITAAADNPASKNNYMGDVARVHAKLRKHTADMQTIPKN